MDPGNVIAVVLGLPALGFAARLVVKPMADAFVRSRELKAGVRSDSAQHEAQAQRIAQLEAELGTLRDELGRLSAVESFYAQLQAPDAPRIGSRAAAPES